MEYCYKLWDKLINIIRSLYGGSRCTVRLGIGLGEGFDIVTRDRQDCVLFTKPLCIAIDWEIKWRTKELMACVK